MTSKSVPLIAICGATASGKSEVAIELAKAQGGEIINIDSMQIYRAFDIGSAKLKGEDLGGIRHHLIDELDPDSTINAKWYGDRAFECYKEILTRQAFPIAVVGTALYLKAMLYDLAQLPSRVDDQANQEDLYDKLAEVDPKQAESLHHNDRLRVARALEIKEKTGQSAGSLRAQHGFTDPRLSALLVVLDPPREKLYERINQRSAQMLKLGFNRRD